MDPCLVRDSAKALVQSTELRACEQKQWAGPDCKAPNDLAHESPTANPRPKNTTDGV